MLKRMIGVLTLNRGVYEEIESDSSANMQALIVVLIVGLASGFGGAMLVKNFSTGLIGNIVWAVVGWALLSLIVFVIGAKLFGGEASLAEVMRLLGFAYTPALLGVLGGLLALFPFIGAALGTAIYMVAFAWTFITMFIATQEALDLGAGKTAVTLIAGFFVYLIGLGVILQFLGR